MCQAIREYEQECMFKGRMEGREEGRMEGREEEKREGALRMVNYMRKMNFPENEILKFVMGANNLTAEQASALLAIGV